MPSKIIYSHRVYANDRLQEASVYIKDGIIVDVFAGKKQLSDIECIDYENLVIFPGVVDAHIHINEPGRTEWEGFHSATLSAAKGGITTLVDMPLNSSPVTIDADSFDKKIKASHNQRHVHCGFWGGLVPSNSTDLSGLMQKGVLGFKAFLTPSGIDEFQHVTEKDLINGLKQLKGTGLPLLAHCEFDSYHEGITAFKKNPYSYKHFLHSRPKSWENDAVRKMIALCREFRTPIHIVHLSSAEVLPDILSAKEEGLPLTVETCPHYLFFEAEQIPDGDTRYKCTPPIREKENNELLWQALESGLIDFIASDHSPAPESLKEIQSGNLWEAWGGIIGGQCLLTATWTKAKQRGIQLENLTKWLCEYPATFIGFGKSKGKIQKGYDADLLVWNPEKRGIVTKESLFCRHTCSPYVGQELFGEVVATYCGGEAVVVDGEIGQLGGGGVLEFLV
jgi:allantoinase